MFGGHRGPVEGGGMEAGWPLGKMESKTICTNLVVVVVVVMVV